MAVLVLVLVLPALGPVSAEVSGTIGVIVTVGSMVEGGDRDGNRDLVSHELQAVQAVPV